MYYHIIIFNDKMLDKNYNILFVIYFIPKYNYYYYSYYVLYHRENKNTFLFGFKLHDSDWMLDKFNHLS